MFYIIKCLYEVEIIFTCYSNILWSVQVRNHFLTPKRRVFGFRDSK
jgi:hypothetical protein